MLSYLYPETSELLPGQECLYLCLNLHDSKHTLLYPLAHQESTAVSLEINHQASLGIESSSQYSGSAKSLQSHVTLTHL